MSSKLWHPGLTDEDFETPEIRATVLEQYKIYVEMADRVSARRALANTYFLTLNTVVLTAVGTVVGGGPGRYEAGALLVPAAALVLQCLAWYFLLRSYRQLNTAKYKVVGELEERLPASPYWRAEWHELGEGKDKSRYWQMSHVEQWIPALFAVVYVVGFAGVAFAG